MNPFYSLFLTLGVLALSGAAKPNILFIFTDDHAYQAVGAYDSWLKEHCPTPHIDSLARDGMLFEQCYVTNSICGPMRAAIQTGKYSHANGFLVNGNKFNGNQQTFPKLLRKAGYTTAVVGKWHLGTHMSPQGYDYSEVLIGQGPYYNPPMRLDEDGDGKHDKVIKHIGYTTDVITDLALEWMKTKRDKEKPFMLMYSTKLRIEIARAHITKYDNVTLPEPDTLFDDYKGRPGRLSAGYDHCRDDEPGRSQTRCPGNLTPEQKNFGTLPITQKMKPYKKRT